jgi:hypothetical protein
MSVVKKFEKDKTDQRDNNGSISTGDESSRDEPRVFGTAARDATR